MKTTPVGRDERTRVDRNGEQVAAGTARAEADGPGKGTGKKSGTRRKGSILDEVAVPVA